MHCGILSYASVRRLIMGVDQEIQPMIGQNCPIIVSMVTFG